MADLDDLEECPFCQYNVTTIEPDANDVDDHEECEHGIEGVCPICQYKVTTVESDANDDDHEECEDGIECGCCFSKFAFVSPHGIYI